MVGNSRSGHRGFAVATCAAVMAAAVSANPCEAGAIERIERYCAASWRNAQIAEQDWEECTQEAFAELLARVPRDRLPKAIESRQSNERRELNRTIWCTIKRWRRAPRFYSLQGDTLDHRTSSSAPVGLADEARDLLENGDLPLSNRQRKILTLWAEGGSIADIARQLALPPARVSDEKYKALRKLRLVVAESEA